MFNCQQQNGLADYLKVEPTPCSELADQKVIDERYRFVQDVLIPAISKHVLETQKADHAKFAKKHKIIENSNPIGSKLIHNVTDNGAYTLMDRTGALLSRDVPTHHIVYKAAVNPKPITVHEFKNEHYEIQAVINYKGTPGNYQYLVQWKGFDDSIENKLEPVENFNSTKHIELYWGRRNGEKAAGKRRVTPPTVNWKKFFASRKSKQTAQKAKRS
ncbi:hypothetical protein G6F42_013878 [Rhizopus arrhizus]|nr:hypothetical protein G6F42_013878 [Rhizopus arrhizus]